MAKFDRRNRAKFWADRDLTGVSLLRAAFDDLQYAPHVHDELVIAVTEAGAGRFVTRRAADVAAPRSVLIFNAHEAHEGGVATAEGWRYRALYLDGRALAQAADALELPPGGLPYFPASVVGDAGLAERIIAAHAAFEDRAGRLERESRLLGLLAGLYTRHGRPGRAPPAAAGNPGRSLDAARDALHQRFADDLAVPELAALAGMSAYRFISAFRRRFGLPPHAYLTQVRLTEARRLLAVGAAPAAAAAEAGFYDQSHLTNRFKRAYGITPGQYRAALCA